MRARGVDRTANRTRRRYYLWGDEGRVLGLRGLRSERPSSPAAGLTLAGVHIFRHSAAKLRRDAGESVEDVGRFLDHSSLAVTSVYLRRLEGQEDRGWAKVAEAIGLSALGRAPR